MTSTLICLLCTLTSFACGGLLYAEFRRSRTRVLAWTAGCFACLGLNNLMLFTDLIIIPEKDLSALRLVAAVIGYAILIWGFVWDIP